MLGANSIVGAWNSDCWGSCSIRQTERNKSGRYSAFWRMALAIHLDSTKGINTALRDWKLPIVMSLRINRLYAISTRTREVRNIDYLSDRAVAYNIPGVVVDGNDVIAVYEAVGQAVKLVQGKVRAPV